MDGVKPYIDAINQCNELL